MYKSEKDLHILIVAVFSRAVRDCMGDTAPLPSWGYKYEMSIIKSAYDFLKENENSLIFKNICIYNKITKEEVFKAGERILKTGEIPKFSLINKAKGRGNNAKNSK